MKTLIKIQKELKAPKNQYNSFGKYNYRNCEDILEAVKPLLGDCILTLSDEVVNIGAHNYVKASATFQEGEEIKSVSAYAREAEEQKGMNDAQITGSSSSYARKYALNGLFLIDDTKDDDTTNKHGKGATQEDEELEEETPFEKAKRLIAEEDDLFGLRNLERKIAESTKLTDKEKTELAFIANEKALTLDPTKD